ncbi:MAG: nitroreductase family protein [Candidatus Omnitrophica bacterium CG11_big_fil_rev_8_21_14_0_20_42_13]|uniref:Nitroreductase family protein n=1 Tax=Candidatus Ghiorseimicrobium undicola TaxID=1974746 RepID=A0A2H0LX28_9BACT|nr:MAG: nitroreductase family protein [Candidatus Omnitrophica bacterium CG11_big_fil_rev_8_21_14_0_20_42_13]
MDFFEAIKKRCSVREYSEKPVKKEDIEKIVGCARLAPTARGEQPWEFVVVTDKKELAEIADMTDHGKFLKGASAGIIVLCKDTKYYLEDGSAATENILLAAAALGIGSCWVAGDKKPYADKIREYLGAGPGYKLVSIVSLGYPKGGFIAHKKREVSQVLHLDKF